MKTLLDVDQLLEEYRSAQERLSNPHAKKLMEYYSTLEEPVLLANLTKICSIVRKKNIQETRAGSTSLALYGPISVDVLVELKEKYDTVLTPPIVQTIQKVMLQTLRIDAHLLPLSSIKSCVEALEEEHINLLAEPISL